MENVVNKIREFRTKKGYSHETMAHELHMSQPAYSKIEKNETKLSVERLFEIAKILETPVEQFLEINPNNIYHQNNNDNGTFVGHQEVQNLYQDNKDKSDKIELLFEARLQDKDALIEQLKKMLEKLG
jgi:transcriptional regulator with XRE-family HTH domain